ncbi:hypothetical protein ACFL3S_05660 [Gemmatimonadota bacterium]
MTGRDVTDQGHSFWARLEDGRCYRFSPVLESEGEIVGLVAEGQDDHKIEVRVALQKVTVPRFGQRFKKATKTWWRMMRGYRYVRRLK